MTFHYAYRRLLVPLLSLVLFALPLSANADAGEAADWIAAELEEAEPAFDLFGTAAARTDVVFALASADSRPGAVRQALADLEEAAAEYVGEPGETSPGAAAKLLLALLVARESPDSLLPGRNLEAELRGLQQEDGSFAPDVFSHSLAVIALGASEGGAPDDAAQWLADRQNFDGSWASGFNEDDPDAPDVDVTALAIQAMLAAGNEASVDDAAGFLIDAQNPDGSWTDAFGLRNANTAGLAGQALRAAGEIEAADRAADFVITLQNDDGGIRYTAEETESNGYATLQGILALGGPAYHELVAHPFADVAWEHLFADEIDWLGDSDIARGCDPPSNDRFCPDEHVTRGQMAAFLTRALGLTGGHFSFVDTEGHVFEQEVSALADTSITRGCNPPDNDRFCPDDPITRGQMAAMLHRALSDQLPAGQPDQFEDTTDHVFADDIQWLSATGITRGCNPPDNDQFCPDDPITRGQMAAMLYRALAG